MAIIAAVPQEELDLMQARSIADDDSSVWGENPTQGYVNAKPLLPDLPLPNIVGTVGKTNVILIADLYAEILNSMMPSIQNGYWYIGDTNTLVPAVGTEPTLIVQVPGVYEYFNRTIPVSGMELTVQTGGLAVVKDGSRYYAVVNDTVQNITLTSSDKFVMIDKTGAIFKTDQEIVPAGYTPIFKLAVPEGVTDLTEEMVVNVVRLQDVINLLVQIDQTAQDVEADRIEVVANAAQVVADKDAAAASALNASNKATAANSYAADAFTHATAASNSATAAATSESNVSTMKDQIETWYNALLAGGGSGASEDWSVLEANTVIGAKTNLLVKPVDADITLDLPITPLEFAWYHVKLAYTSTYVCNINTGNHTIHGDKGTVNPGEQLTLEAGNRVKLLYTDVNEFRVVEVD